MLIPKPLSDVDLERIGLAMDKRRERLAKWRKTHAANLNPDRRRAVKFSDPKKIQELVSYPEVPRDIEMNEREE